MFRRLFGRTSESRSSSAGTTAADADANRASSVDGCGSNSSEKETHTLSRPELSDMQLQRLPIRVGSGGTVSVFGRRARRSDHTFSKALVVSRLPLPCIHIGSSQLVYYEVEVIPTFSSQWVGSLCLGVTLTPLPSSQDAQLRFKEDEAATPSEAQAQQPCEEIDEELYQEELRLDELAAAEFDDAAPDKRFEAVLSDTFMVHPYSYLLTSNYNSAMVGELYCLDATGTASDASASRQRVERYAEMIVAPSTAGARGIGIGVDLATHRMHIWPPGTTSSAASVSLPLPTGVHQPRFYAAIEVYGVR